MYSYQNLKIIRLWRTIESMIFIETKVFTKLVQSLLSDDEYRELQTKLIEQPDTGDIIRGSGGLRKMRWSLEGKGKSGGVRIIYYWVSHIHEIRIIYMYPKHKQENLTPEQLKLLKDMVERWS